jgi:Flp pilus assembly protein TadB
MLDKDERNALREIELQIAAADPDLAALLRGQRGLAPAAIRTCLRCALALLVLLTVAMLVLGLPASALATAAVTAGLWWRWRHHVGAPVRVGRRSGSRRG